MKIKRILFSLVSLILIVSMLGSCGILSFFEQDDGENEDLYIGPIESGFSEYSSGGSGNGGIMPDNDLKIAWRIEDNYISADEDLNITLFYGWDEAKYRDIVPESHGIAIKVTIYNEVGLCAKKIIEENNFTVGDVKNQAREVNGEWQFGISKEYTIPKELLVFDRNGRYRMDIIIFDTEEEDLATYGSMPASPFCWPGGVYVFYDVNGDMCYFHHIEGSEY